MVLKTNTNTWSINAAAAQQYRRCKSASTHNNTSCFYVLPAYKSHPNSTRCIHDYKLDNRIHTHRQVRSVSQRREICFHHTVAHTIAHGERTESSTPTALCIACQLFDSRNSCRNCGLNERIVDLTSLAWLNRVQGVWHCCKRFAHGIPSPTWAPKVTLPFVVIMHSRHANHVVAQRTSAKCTTRLQQQHRD